MLVHLGTRNHASKRRSRRASLPSSRQSSLNEPEHLHADLQDQTQVREHEEVKTQHQTFHRRRWQTLQLKLRIKSDVSDDDTRDQKEDHLETTAEEEMMDQETEEATRNHSSTTISSTGSSATSSTRKTRTNQTKEDLTAEMEMVATSHPTEEETTLAEKTSGLEHQSPTTSRAPAPPPRR